MCILMLGRSFRSNDKDDIKLLFDQPHIVPAVQEIVRWNIEYLQIKFIILCKSFLLNTRMPLALYSTCIMVNRHKYIEI